MAAWVSCTLPDCLGVVLLTASPLSQIGRGSLVGARLLGTSVSMRAAVPSPRTRLVQLPWDSARASRGLVVKALCLVVEEVRSRLYSR